MLNRVWLKAEGAPFYVRTGAAEYPRGPVTWQPRKLFTPATDRYLDFETNGPLIAIEFASDNWFKVFGYKAEFALNEGDF